MKNEKNSGWEEIDLVTPTPDLRADWNYTPNDVLYAVQTVDA